MRTVKWLSAIVVFILVNQNVFSQQLKLGKNPYSVEKSAVLELVSDNQGLLLPRIADTTSINALSPPDGMIIFYSPDKKLLIRANNSWRTLETKDSVVTSLNGNTGALTMDTGYISNFYQKVRGLFSGGSGINYDSNTGIISSSINTGNFWNISGNSGTNSSTNFIGTTDNQDLVFKTNNTETTRIVASTGDIKIGNATTGTIRATKELVLRQDGDTYGSSILRLRNRNAENGAIFETTDPSITLVDFIFKTATSQRNIRYEARSSMAKAGTPSFHIGGASPDNPTLAVGDNYAAFNTNLKIGNYNSPTEALDVTGNIRFSGALMPNNSAGTSGYVLSSNGSGIAPTWKNFTLSNLNDVSLSSLSNGQLLQYNGTNWVNTTPSYLTSIDTSNISNFYLKVRSLLSGGTGISYNNSTGVITNSGVTSLNGNTGALTMDTGYISNFYLKVRALHSVSAPLTYNSSTGAIAITQANSTTNGYLSSTDWNTFNNKGAALIFSTGLTNSSNTITNDLSTGIAAANQNIYGSTSASGTLTLNSTTHATKGKILFGSSAYDEVNNKLNIGTTTSQQRLTIGGSAQEAISRDVRTGALEIMGGTSEATGAYFQITGDQNSTNSPYEGSAEFVIRNLTRSQFTLWSYDGASTWIQRMQMAGATGNTWLAPNGGNIGVGLTVATTPTALLHLAAGTSTASTAPLKFTAGTNLTTPEDGAVEYNGTHYYITIGSTRYQLDQQTINSLNDPGSNGVLVRTALNTTTSRTLTGTANRITLTNGDGVSGNPTIDVGSNIIDKTVSNTYTGGAKQTFVNSASTAGFNLIASSDPSTPASGDFWNSTTTANSLKYRDAASTTRILVDLSLAQTLTNKTISGASNTLSNIPNSALTNSSITLATGTTGTDVGVTGSPVSLGGTVTLNIPIASATNTGKLSSSDWTTFNNKLSSIDTSNISSFYLKVRGLFSNTAPITYNSSTGLIGITQATTSTNGYLSSADWNTFNNKVDASSPAFTGITTINSLNLGIQSIATSGGTTTLTSASPYYTVFTGSSTQSIVLPNATTLSVGQVYVIENNSTGAVTAKTNGGATLWIIAATAELRVILTANGTAAGTWQVDYLGGNYASGKLFTVNNTITFNGTDGTTMTLPTTSKTIAANDGSNWTISGQAIGDIPVASSTTAYGKLADVATGSVLVSGGVGVAPNWSSTPSITTPATTDNSTKVATTAFVKSATQPMNSTFTVLTSGAAITWTPVVGTNIYTLTPGISPTINMGTIPAGMVGQYMTLIVTTSGITSYTITAGTNLKMQGTLATGTTTAKKFVIQYLIESTTSVLEVSRTTAL